MGRKYDDCEWHLIYEGCGAVNGGNWFEEVAYLENGQWLIRLYDDPAWTLEDQEPMEPEDKTSEELVDWVKSIDSASEEDSVSRVRERALYEIAEVVGDKKCMALLSRSLFPN